jgi:hypothetical protein
MPVIFSPWLAPSFRKPTGALKLVVIATVCLVGAAILGGVMGASTLVVHGSAEQGQGAYLSEQSPGYWGWQSSTVGVIPNPVPARVSGSAAAPTPLPAGSRSYVINAATVGHTSVRWIFGEAATTPASTELELRFVVGLVNPAVQITVYVETQATAPRGAPAYGFYWDAGVGLSGAITIETMQVLVFVCTSVGHCP